MKFTPFVVLASCVAFVAAAPLSDSHAREAVDAKFNHTDAAASPRSVGYGGYSFTNPAYGAYVPGSFYNQYSPNVAHSHGYPSAMALPYSYNGQSYYPHNLAALPANTKTIGHIRGLQQSSIPYMAQPQMYAQPQVYAVPIASAYSQYNHQPQYGYPAYNSYDSYSSLYRRATTDEPEMTAQPQSPMQPAVNYHTKYILEQPEYVKDQPQIIELQSPTGSRAGLPSPSNGIIATNLIPNDLRFQMADFREVAMDDKLQFNPQYPMNRYQAREPAPYWKAAADEPPMAAYEGQLDPEDKVYVTFDSVQPEVNSHVTFPTTTVKNAEQSAFYPTQMSWGANYPAMASQGGYPYLPENVVMAMQKYYEARYQQQLDEMYRHLSQKRTAPSSEQRSADELPGLGDKIKGMMEKPAASEVSKNSNSVNEQKKDMKDEKSAEKSL